MRTGTTKCRSRRQAFERLRNAFGQWINRVDESTGLTKKLAEALTFLANNLDTVMQWLKRIAEVGLAVLIYRLIPALITAWQTAGAAAVTAASATAAAWTTANLSVSAAVASVGVLKTAFAVLGAFLVGWEIGTWLSEKFEIVRKAGIFMVEMLVKAVGVNQAIQRIRESEEILNKTLDAEAKAHQTAAQSALTARDQIQQTLTQTENQIDQITAKLKDGLKVTLDADTTRFDTFNRNTGAFVVTLGALPDVGSSLVLTWNVPTQETQQPSTTLKAAQSLALNPPVGTAVQPGSLTVAWEYGGTKTATAATSGALSGAATGSLSVAQNRVDFAPNVLPAVGTQLTVSYVAGPKQEDSFAHPSRNGTGTLPVTATLGAIEPGSLEVEWNTLTDTSVLGAYEIPNLNVMFEFGYFYGQFGKEKVAILKYGDFYLPSDLGGYIHIFGSKGFKRGAVTAVGKRTSNEFTRWVQKL